MKVKRELRNSFALITIVLVCGLTLSIMIPRAKSSDSKNGIVTSSTRTYIIHGPDIAVYNAWVESLSSGSPSGVMVSIDLTNANYTADIYHTGWWIEVGILAYNNGELPFCILAPDPLQYTPEGIQPTVQYSYYRHYKGINGIGDFAPSHYNVSTTPFQYEFRPGEGVKILLHLSFEDPLPTQVTIIVDCPIRVVPAPIYDASHTGDFEAATTNGYEETTTRSAITPRHWQDLIHARFTLHVADTEDYIDYANETIQDLPDELFNQTTEDVPAIKDDFSDLFNDTLENINEGDFIRAIEKLNVIRQKVYEEMVECAEREELIALIDDLIAYLETLL